MFCYKEVLLRVAVRYAVVVSSSSRHRVVAKEKEVWCVMRVQEVGRF